MYIHSKFTGGLGAPSGVGLCHQRTTASCRSMNPQSSILSLWNMIKRFCRLHGILMKMLLLWRVWTICLCILWIAELFLPPVFEYNWFVYSTMSWVTLAVLLEYNLFVYVNHRVARFLWCHLFIPAGFNTIFVILWIAEVWWCRYEHVFMYALLLLIMSMCHHHCQGGEVSAYISW